MRRRSLLALIGAAALAPASIAAPAAATPHRFRLRHDDPRFGGFSALHLSANGRDCLLLSDRGTLVALRLARDAQGQITGAEVQSLTNLKGPRGTRLARHLRDSEGLARAPDGQIYISFEGVGGGRVWRYARPNATPEILPRHPDFGIMPLNGSLEALAIDQRGRLWTIPEQPVESRFPLYRFDAGGWDIAGHLKPLGRFLPVALDFGPDGAAYLLERDFRFPIGFASRLSRLDGGPDARRHVLWQSRLGQFDNLEGLAITRHDANALRATMVSDDNFLPVQRSELVEWVFPVA
jgi:hypothetical protein